MGKKHEDFTVAMRSGKNNSLSKGADISMECQFYVNLTRQLRTMRGSHIDRPSELFAGLLYFRDKDDESNGSSLTIHTAKSDSLYPKPGQISIDKLPMEISAKKVLTVNTINYEANTLVLFLNSARSIHSVTPRSATLIPRRHINFCGDIT